MNAMHRSSDNVNRRPHFGFKPRRQRLLKQPGGRRSSALRPPRHESIPAVMERSDVPVPAKGLQRPSWLVMGVAVASVCIVGLIGAFVVPVLIQAHQAYEQIFVTPVPRPKIVINPDGTPEIVADDPGSSEEADDVAPEDDADPRPTPEPVMAELPDWEYEDRVNVLLLGLDFVQDDIPSRSDTMMIASIDSSDGTVSVLSIPRDLLVTIPGVGETRINEAYAYGESGEFTGPGLAMTTVEYNFGIPIHYFVQVDILGFEHVINTIGGVIIDVPAPIKDDLHPGWGPNYDRVYFHTGLQHMDGWTAVQYARSRSDDNDFARGFRQQQILLAAREQGVNRNLITRAHDLVDDLAGAVRTDFSLRQTLALASMGHDMNSEDIHLYSMQHVVTVQWAPGQPYYLIPDWDAVDAMLDDMMSR